MSGEAVEPRRQGLFLSLLCWLLGTKSAVLAVQLAFLLLVAALTALAGVLILDLPLWTLGALAGAIAVTFRIAVPIVLHFVPLPALDWQAVPVPGEEAQGGKDGNQEGTPVRRRRRRVGH